jgi:hypothetical protein
MRTPLRHATPALTALLAAAALAPGLLQPTVASANAATRSEHAAQRAERAAERVSRREARERERLERHETRERERTERRAARHDSSVKGAEETGAAPPASAPRSTGGSTTSCQATIEASSNLITAGETVSVFGKVACPGNESADGLQLTVSESQRESAASAAGATALGAAHVASDGTYRLESLALQHTTIFHVRLGNRQARAVVKVAPVVTLKGPDPTAKASTIGGTHAGSTARVTFTGTVMPAQAGTIVSLRVAYGGDGQWQTAALGRVGEGGAYSLTHSFKTPGLVRVRVIAHVHGHSNVNGSSETLAYQVTVGDATSAGTLVPVQPALPIAQPGAGVASQLTTSAFATNAAREHGPSPVTAKTV